MSTVPDAPCIRNLASLGNPKSPRRVMAVTNQLSLTGFCHDHALILYVYLSHDDMESVLTVSLPPSLPPSIHPSSTPHIHSPLTPPILKLVLHSILQHLTPYPHVIHTYIEHYISNHHITRLRRRKIFKMPFPQNPLLLPPTPPIQKPSLSDDN